MGRKILQSFSFVFGYTEHRERGVLRSREDELYNGSQCATRKSETRASGAKIFTISFEDNQRR